LQLGISILPHNLLIKCDKTGIGAIFHIHGQIGRENPASVFQYKKAVHVAQITAQMQYPELAFIGYGSLVFFHMQYPAMVKQPVRVIISIKCIFSPFLYGKRCIGYLQPTKTGDSFIFIKKLITKKISSWRQTKE
jgi:hypothetical protein